MELRCEETGVDKLPYLESQHDTEVPWWSIVYRVGQPFACLSLLFSFSWLWDKKLSNNAQSFTTVPQ